MQITKIDNRQFLGFVMDYHENPSSDSYVLRKEKKSFSLFLSIKTERMLYSECRILIKRNLTYVKHV